MTLLTLRLDGTELAVELTDVVEVVRMPPVRALPSAVPPLVGVATVREATVRVLDTRSAGAVTGRDLLVLEGGDALVCDEVIGVREDEPRRELAGLPGYARGLLADGTVVVDLAELVASATPQT